MEETKDNERCCGNCLAFYDAWADGTGKCEKAHGGITTSDNVCKAWE